VGPRGRTFGCALGVLLIVPCAGCTDDPSSSIPPTPLESPSSEPAAPAWQRLTPVLTPRTEVTAATDGAVVYVIGGFGEAGGSVDTVEVFDPRTGGWSAGPDLPHAVDHAMSAGLDGAVYVMGGYVGSDPRTPTDRAFVFSNGSWVELPRMPEPRAAAGAAAVLGKVYVAGGVGPGGLAVEMMVFDPASATWTREPGPTPREHLGVASAGGRLFVVGGRTAGLATNVDTAEVYDPVTSQWTSLPDMPTARGGIAAAGTSNGYVVSVGGEAEATFDEAEVLDVGTEEWWSLPPMPTARHGLGVVATGTVIIVFAGGPEPGLTYSDATEAIDLAPLTTQN
jgi:N-acetylneuraminic acid mutarotase